MNTEFGNVLFCLFLFFDDDDNLWLQAVILIV